MDGLVRFSPLRWDFVCQRSQLLMSRVAVPSGQRCSATVAKKGTRRSDVAVKNLKRKSCRQD